jgi:hypothetical protein
MTTRNASESSVRSHRFVFRLVAQTRIFGLVRRGKGSLGYPSSSVRSPTIPQGNGPLGGGPLDDRRGNGRHLGSDRLRSDRLGNEVAP